jgi:hypothetical protein
LGVILLESRSKLSHLSRRVIALALLSLLRWRHCHHHAGLSTIIALVSLPFLRWPHHPCCVGIFAGATLVLIALVALAFLP